VFKLAGNYKMESKTNNSTEWQSEAAVYFYLDESTRVGYRRPLLRDIGDKYKLRIPWTVTTIGELVDYFGSSVGVGADYFHIVVNGFRLLKSENVDILKDGESCQFS